MSQKKPTDQAAAAAGDVTAPRASLELCDAISQDSNAKIAALAELTLASLQGPRGLELIDRFSHLENIGHCLRTIAELAFDAMNTINCEAENHGCHYKSRQQGSRAERWQA